MIWVPLPACPAVAPELNRSLLSRNPIRPNSNPPIPRQRGGQPRGCVQADSLGANPKVRRYIRGFIEWMPVKKDAAGSWTGARMGMGTPCVTRWRQDLPTAAGKRGSIGRRAGTDSRLPDRTVTGGHIFGPSGLHHCVDLRGDRHIMESDGRL